MTTIVYESKSVSYANVTNQTTQKVSGRQYASASARGYTASQAQLASENLSIELAIGLANEIVASEDEKIVITDTHSESKVTIVGDEYVNIKILTLNDTYDPKYMGQWKQKQVDIFNVTPTDTLQLSIFGGDFLFPNKGSSIMQGNDMVLASNICHFDAIGVGNHEFDAGQNILAQLSLESNSPLICSNISKTTCDKLNLEYNYTLLKGGINVGIIAFVTQETSYISLGGTGIDFLSIDEMFNLHEKFLSNCDLKCLIFHAKISYLYDYMKLHPEKKKLVDFVVCGHEHIIFADYIERDNGCPIPVVEMGSDTSGIGIIDLVLNKTRKYPVESSVRVEVIDTLTAPIYPASKILLDWVNKIEAPFFKEEIGIVLNYNLNGIKSSIRNQETNLSDLVADSYLYSGIREPFAIIPENIASILNSGSIKNNSIIPINTKITTETVYTIVPFQNALYAIVVKGRSKFNELITYLGKASFSKKNTGGWLQISKNLVFNYVNNTYTLTNGTNNETDLFYLMMPDYLANGGDEYSELIKYDRLLLGTPCQNALINYIKFPTANYGLNGQVSYATTYTRIILPSA